MSVDGARLLVQAQGRGEEVFADAAVPVVGQDARALSFTWARVATRRSGPGSPAFAIWEMVLMGGIEWNTPTILAVAVSSATRKVMRPTPPGPAGGRPVSMATRMSSRSVCRRVQARV
ncbi:hypothetical protein ACFWIB_42780 [Streptomyces sp. NPDC127051]|uniref:hypothetical protein n=1 Tax=Streptomyces sp. NPDC127051 TaxID=3347119 RepID=UPI003650D1DB